MGSIEPKISQQPYTVGVKKLRNMETVKQIFLPSKKK
jgi:hypothetical protein